ncbi:restriction endonuclease subunit S [Vibrio splendidus]|uniref:restriction endonuclease subunit S n=1 Tax=Vibrio splendidus TaxID=29497 RepID=UPI00352C7839
MNVEQISMNQLITDNIDVWTSTVKTKSASGRGSSKKRELYGVKKLRELILELAVRGKLVPQDPNDESASVLLDRIKDERRAEAKNGKLKEVKAISDNESPCQLPINWSFARLEEIIQISSGKNLTAKKMDTSGKIPVYGGNGVTGIHSESNVSEKTIVIGRVGFYCGSVHLTPAYAWVTDNAFITKYSRANLDEDFLVWLLKATNLSENDSATAQPVISGKKVYPIVVALPPKEEQRLIAAKIDELMALCDQLEQQTEASIAAHQILVTTLLDTLTNSADADELMQNWARISEHFNTLFTTEASIDQLKQTILQLAVMGKLVPQDPTDEPAAKLLERIAEEKEQLIKDKKIKKQKALPPITDDEKPFELPNGWEWCRLGALFKSFSNGLYKPAKFYTDSGVISLRMYNIQSGNIDFEGAKRVEVEPHELEQFLLEKGDLLINRVNSKELVGKTAIIPEFDEPLVYESMNMRAKPFSDYVSAEYLNLFMMTALAQQSISSFAKEAIGQASINQGQVSSIVITLPPNNEQKRIVLKVNEILVVCEKLKELLTESKGTQLYLTDAIVEQAV